MSQNCIYLSNLSKHDFMTFYKQHLTRWKTNGFLCQLPTFNLISLIHPLSIKQITWIKFKIIRVCFRQNSNKAKKVVSLAFFSPTLSIRCCFKSLAEIFQVYMTRSSAPCTRVSFVSNEPCSFAKRFLPDELISCLEPLLFNVLVAEDWAHIRHSVQNKLLTHYSRKKRHLKTL